MSVVIWDTVGHFFPMVFPMVFSDGIFRWYFPMVFSDGIFRWYFPMVFSDGIKTPSKN